MVVNEADDAKASASLARLRLFLSSHAPNGPGEAARPASPSAQQQTLTKMVTAKAGTMLHPQLQQTTGQTLALALKFSWTTMMKKKKVGDEPPSLLQEPWPV